MLRFQILFSLLSLLLISSLCAQDTHKIDSIASRLDEDMHDSVRYRLLFDIASEIEAKDTLKSFDYLNRGRQGHGPVP